MAKYYGVRTEKGKSRVVGVAVDDQDLIERKLCEGSLDKVGAFIPKIPLKPKEGVYLEKDIPLTKYGTVAVEISGVGKIVPRIDLSEDEASYLNKLKEALLDKIRAHDTSSEVNEFLYKGEKMWIARNDRVAITNGIKAEIELGFTKTKLTLPNGVQVEMKVTDALKVLYAVEVYAKACYNVTVSHLKNASLLKTKEALDAYDYKTGYPKKLNF